MCSFARLMMELYDHKQNFIISIRMHFECFALHVTEQFTKRIYSTMASVVDTPKHLNYTLLAHTHTGPLFCHLFVHVRFLFFV